MLRLDKVIKPWKESAALNDHINLYGFWNETAFLTKSGDVGMILSVPGVDYESRHRSEQEYASTGRDPDSERNDRSTPMTTPSFTLARLRRRREAFLNPRLPERCLAGDRPGRLIAVEVEV